MHLLPLFLYYTPFVSSLWHSTRPSRQSCTTIVWLVELGHPKTHWFRLRQQPFLKKILPATTSKLLNKNWSRQVGYFLLNAILNITFIYSYLIHCIIRLMTRNSVKFLNWIAYLHNQTDQTLWITNTNALIMIGIDNIPHTLVLSYWPVMHDARVTITSYVGCYHYPQAMI